jgi:hypothetical protein
MPTYEITFRDTQRRPEIVHADGMRRTRTAVVFYTVQLVVLTPREIVVRRLASAEVADIRELGERRAMVTGDEYRVERILLQRSLRRPPRPHLRVTWRGQWIADCATPAQVARYVELASLTDEE